MRMNSLGSNGVEVVHTIGRQSTNGQAILDVPRVDGFSIVVQQIEYSEHTIWRRGRLFHQGSHPSASVTVIDLSEVWSCRPGSNFETVHFTFTNSSLRNFAVEHGQVPFGLPTVLDGPTDPILNGLINTFVPYLATATPHTKLLTDHLLEALKVHISGRYGGLALSERKGGLTDRQLDTALQFLVSADGQGSGIEEVAALTGLSVSYFIRGFKRSTGLTPYQWMLEYRITKAQEMLRKGMPVAQVALECNFADQSHFSRVFKSKRGFSPVNWLNNSS